MPCRLPIAAAALLLAASAWATVADALRQGTHAMAQGKAAEAATAFRRAFEGTEATAAERRQAVGGLLAAAGERGKRAELMAYVQQRVADAPEGTRRVDAEADEAVAAQDADQLRHGRTSGEGSQ